jgi:tetratricopeptide (TPR) repeat protein
MMIRNAFAALGALGMAALVSQAAHAAVTVIGGNNLARSCYEAAEFGGNPTDGVAVCSDALKQDTLPLKDRAATLINRGILLSRTDDAEAAIADYDRGLMIDATLGEGYVDRGAALIILKRYDEALQALNKGIDLGSSQLQVAYYDRAIVQEALGNVRRAYEDYKMAVQIEPDFALATAQLTRFKVVRRHTDGT